MGMAENADLPRSDIVRLFEQAFQDAGGTFDLDRFNTPSH
jgi:hypothetical protein